MGSCEASNARRTFTVVLELSQTNFVLNHCRAKKKRETHLPPAPLPYIWYCKAKLCRLT